MYMCVYMHTNKEIFIYSTRENYSPDLITSPSCHRVNGCVSPSKTTQQLDWAAQPTVPAEIVHLVVWRAS